MRHVIAAAAAAFLVAGCASFDGRGLVAGQSRAADVEALMGAPAEKVAASNRETLWFYPRQPFGRQTFAVRLGPDGVVRGVEPRLTVENVYKLVPGRTNVGAVRELLGPPWRVSHLDRQQREVWEYAMYSANGQEAFLFVQFYGDVVREVLLLRDNYFDPGGTKD